MDERCYTLKRKRGMAVSNYIHDADIVVVGYCGICGQGRHFVAKANTTGAYLVYCEECGFRWESPSAAKDPGLAFPPRETAATQPWQARPITFVSADELRD